MPDLKDIKELYPKELQNILTANKFPAFHARQIFSWIYKKNALSFSSMSDIPRALQAFLNGRFIICRSSIRDIQTSNDATKKIALGLADGNIIEAVYIPASGRGTLCLSSQVGCKFSCAFCASLKSGWVRNLSASEILEQIILVKNNISTRVTHIVFMGIGEPLDNFDNVFKAISVINSKCGFDIGKRRITISTCGIIPAIERLAESNISIELSVSLHAAEDKRRSLIMPINRVYPLPKLMKALQKYQERTNRQITFEYALIKDFNTQSSDVIILKRLFSLLDCKLNLIKLNPVSGSIFKPANETEVIRFSQTLKKAGIRVTVREPRGEDILAACGQLRANLLGK